eukprot:2478903-Rhodomonas_salina.1
MCVPTCAREGERKDEQEDEEEQEQEQGQEQERETKSDRHSLELFSLRPLVASSTMRLPGTPKRLRRSIAHLEPSKAIEQSHHAHSRHCGSSAIPSYACSARDNADQTQACSGTDLGLLASCSGWMAVT